MYDLPTKKSKKKRTLLDYYKKPQIQSLQPSIISNMMPKKRKLNGKLDNFFQRKQITEQYKIKLYFLCQLASMINPATFFEKIKPATQIATQLDSKLNITGFASVIFYSFIIGHKHSLWSHKYAPQQIQQLFQSEISKKMINWLNTFHLKGQILPSQDSNVYSRNNNNTKQAKALILAGRQGIGKLSLIRCVAKSLRLEIYECRNDSDRLKYLKQKKESTKSQCVKNIKKTKQIDQDDSNTLNRYLLKKQEAVSISTEDSRPKKIHIIHQINQIYPVEIKSLFYKQLKALMDQSMIPFIFTTTQNCTLKEFKNCQILQFGQPNSHMIAKLFWMILHTEYFLSQYQPNLEIKKEDFEKILWNFFQNIQIGEERISLEKIIELVELSGNNFNILYNLFQISQNFNDSKKELIFRAIQNDTYHAQLKQNTSQQKNQQHQQQISLQNQILRLQTEVYQDKLQTTIKRKVDRFLGTPWMRRKQTIHNIQSYYSMNKRNKEIQNSKIQKRKTKKQSHLGW